VPGEIVRVDSPGIDVLMGMQNDTLTSFTTTFVALSATSGVFRVRHEFESNVIGLVSYQGNQGVTPTPPIPVRVLPKPWIDDVRESAPAAPQRTLTIVGARLNTTSSVTVGNQAVSIERASPTELTVALPDAAAGLMLLNTRDRGQVPVVQVTARAAAGAIVVDTIELGQTHLQDVASPKLRLVPGKAAGVVVRLRAPTPGLAGEVSVERINASGMAVDRIVLSGPSSVPVSIDHRSLDGAYVGELPGAWIAKGLQLRVRLKDRLVAEATPTVGENTAINLHFVPFKVGQYTASLMSETRVREVLSRYLPFAPDQIRITSSALVDLGIDPASPTMENEMYALGDVATRAERLKRPNTIVVGVLPRKAYRGGPGVPGAYADGWFEPTIELPYILGLLDDDHPASIQDPFGNRLMWSELAVVHELGHVYGLVHAPCGINRDEANNYPFTGGRLGSRPLYLSDYAGGKFGKVRFLDATTTLTDLMSYCREDWLSDYNYALVQQNAEARTVVAARPQAAKQRERGADKRATHLRILGAISGMRAHVTVQVADASAPASAPGLPGRSYTVLLEFEGGATVRLPVTSARVKDAPQLLELFDVSVPNTSRRLVSAVVVSQDKPLSTVLKTF
jgi:hypothetical protein